MNKTEKALVGKTIKSVDEMFDSYLLVKFSDGSLAEFRPKYNSAHNDMWSSVRIDYYDSPEAYKDHIRQLQKGMG